MLANLLQVNLINTAVIVGKQLIYAIKTIPAAAKTTVKLFFKFTSSILCYYDQKS